MALVDSGVITVHTGLLVHEVTETAVVSGDGRKVDADVITFETRSAGPGELEAIGKTITDKKIGIGMIDHHTLQVEQPSEVADLAREALEHIPAERLILTSDCGMGREGMPRRHAFYKIVSLVLGANIVREEAGIPTVPVRAADPEFSFVRTSA